MIDFNRPAFTGREFDYIRDAVQRGMLCGDGEYTKRCSQWMMDKFHVNHVMLTTSCTHALEMAAHLCDIKPGDEVIMPSYTLGLLSFVRAGCATGTGNKCPPAHHAYFHR